MWFERIKRFLLGDPLDPFKQETRKHIALVTFFAWVGLGADGISSSCYGPEEAFVALSNHNHMALFLAFATGITVFVIAFAYLQVIELFPNGGGGYKVAATLLGPRAGLVSGCALIIDYVLTIAISIASGVDALFSIIASHMQPYKLPLEYSLVLLLLFLNLRGMKESIRFLMPIFLSFIITHAGLILYGIMGHASGLTQLVPQAVSETRSMAGTVGWFALLSLFFKAFSLGGGTYTGLEAVSNSVHNLAEPKVKTGKSTLLCVAASLAFMAAGIIMLYLLWDVNRVPGQTMNATTFAKITQDWNIFGIPISSSVVGFLMLLEAGLLFVAANTGFLAGPSVLANMAVDRWMPSLFSSLSSRLVTKNGVVLMGGAAICALFVTGGSVDLLVVLYSINVFLTFTLSLAGICKFRWTHRRQRRSLRKLVIPALAFMVCASILVTTLMEKFLTGGWITVATTGCLILFGQWIRSHYVSVYKKIRRQERDVSRTLRRECQTISYFPRLEYEKPTAVFLVGETNASGLIMFSWVQQNFASIFHNFIFVSVGEIDTEEFADKKKWNKLRQDTKFTLKRYVNFCHNKGLPSMFYQAYGTDVVQKFDELTDRIALEFPKATFFTTKLISERENFMTQILHNQTAYILQRRLHNKGKAMIIMPMML